MQKMPPELFLTQKRIQNAKKICLRRNSKIRFLTSCGGEQVFEYLVTFCTSICGTGDDLAMIRFWTALDITLRKVT